MKVMNLAQFLIAALLAATTAAAQDQLSAAKDLYASAAYEDALSALARVKEGAPELAQEVDEYRAFSLFALGRTSEAESAVEVVIRRNPLAVPDPRDASPRIAEMFGQIRKRLLPELIRDGYRTARATMDKGDVAAAMPQLTRVKSMLDQGKTLGVLDETLADLGMVVDGFLGLARSVADLAAETAAKAAAPAPALAAAPPAANTVVNRPQTIYSATDTTVIAPQAIRQEVPAIPYSVARAISPSGSSGILEVVIDEKGGVESAIMRVPVNSAFDAMVLAAARTWRYRPAMKDGRPVKYMKRLGVNTTVAQ